MQFGSWTFDSSKLMLSNGGFDMSEFMKSGEWEFTGTKVVLTERHYACCPAPYHALHFYFYMRRRTLYYGVNLIFPCILITIMTVVGFALPSECGEKITVRKLP